MHLLWVLAGCVGGDEPVTAPTSELDRSWIAAVATDPASFTALVGPARDGWVAFHRNDLGAASQSPDPAVAWRAWDTLADLHRVLASLSDRAFLALGTTWRDQASLPPRSHVNVVVAAAARQAGDPDAAGWLRRAELAFPSPGAWPAGSALDPTIQARWASPCEGDPVARGATPLATETDTGVTRTFWDPWVHRCLADTAVARRDALPAPTGLARTLFSSDLGPGAGTLAGDLAALGLTVPTGDDGQACRDFARALDGQLDGLRTSLEGASSDDGKALLDDLRLVDVARSRALVGLGVDALERDAPSCALVYAELARDHEQGRSVSPLNTPTLFAVLAAANLRTGHTREALDALEVLVVPFPEVEGLDETIGDLAILQGLHRAGDSREN